MLCGAAVDSSDCYLDGCVKVLGGSSGVQDLSQLPHSSLLNAIIQFTEHSVILHQHTAACDAVQQPALSDVETSPETLFQTNQCFQLNFRQQT